MRSWQWERRIKPHLQALDSAQHVEVSRRILLNHILHIVRPQGFLKLPLGHQEFQNPTFTGDTEACQNDPDYRQNASVALQEKIKQEYCKQKQTAVKRVTRLMSITRLITERGIINYTSGSSPPHAWSLFWRWLLLYTEGKCVYYICGVM